MTVARNRSATRPAKPHAPAATALSPTIERRIAAQLKGGCYASREEVIAEALRLLEERDRLFGPRIAGLQSDVRDALQALDAGEGVGASEAFSTARRRVRSARKVG
ncbi:MAG: type II toxin-antitoxin system ParD family antitoxin [bacterium]